MGHTEHHIRTTTHLSARYIVHMQRLWIVSLHIYLDFPFYLILIKYKLLAGPTCHWDSQNRVVAACLISTAQFLLKIVRMEPGSPESQYKVGSIMDDGGAHPDTPWGLARGSQQLRPCPDNVTPIRRETILIWDQTTASDGRVKFVMKYPLEFRGATSWPFTPQAQTATRRWEGFQSEIVASTS